MKNPGPGEYDPNIDLTKEIHSCYGIGTGKRDFDNAKQKWVPGPGQYNPKSGLSNIAYGYFHFDKKQNWIWSEKGFQ